VRRKTDNDVGFAVIHLIAGLAFIPWFFSWTGVALLVGGIYFFGMLGINLCFHRLLTHRGFSCPLWLERGLALLGVCCVQDSPVHWVAVHRKHHHHADEALDPHTPVTGFFWAHMGWLLVKSEELRRGPLTEQYAKDIVRDPLYAWLERRNHWIKVALAFSAAYFFAGFVVYVLAGEGVAEAVQFGSSLFVWGAALRVVVVWHMTWAVNSVTHVWGTRRYDTPDVSRNNPIVGLLVHGEGWHNNHHADPRSARHGHRWWELDVTWLTIRLLQALRLAKDVALPSAVLAAKFNVPRPLPVPVSDPTRL
jgi:stearoyl-CoA desaturase (delta-9 desaturase)